MCGRFAQYSCRDDYFEAAGIAPEELPSDAEPLGRCNVAPGKRLMLLNQREGQLHFEPAFWGYKPDRRHKAMLINARGVPAAYGSHFS